MRVEGVYTYLCNNCETMFAIVSRFSVKGDRIAALNCPKCSNKAQIVGEGYIKHEELKQHVEHHETPVEHDIHTFEERIENTLPYVLKVEHIAVYLKVSKRVAHEYMNRGDFPLIKIRRSKRVNREDFLKWLSEQKTI